MLSLSQTGEKHGYLLRTSRTGLLATRTIPSAIYAFTQVPGGDAAALRLTLVSVVVSMAALGASELLARRIGRYVSGA